MHKNYRRKQIKSHKMRAAWVNAQAFRSGVEKSRRHQIKQLIAADKDDVISGLPRLWTVKNELYWF